jgi:hypothetical protein
MDCLMSSSAEGTVAMEQQRRITEKDDIAGLSGNAASSSTGKRIRSISSESDYFYVDYDPNSKARVDFGFARKDFVTEA